MAAETPVSSFNMVNTGDAAKREALSLWYNDRASGTGTLASPVWELVGYKLESADMNIDYETDETKKDILGNTFVNLNGPKRSFDLSSWNLIQGSKLQVDVMNALRYEANGGMSYLENGGDFCLVHHYAGIAGSAMLAERWKACGMKPGRLGGDGGANLTTDITVTMGGDKEIGTAAISSGTMTFTKTDAPSAWPSSLT